MNCPNCGKSARNSSFRKLIRRRSKSLWIQASCYQCLGCRTSVGAYKFLTTEQESANTVLANASWQIKYDEELTPVPGATLRKLLQTPEGKRKVAKAFEKVLASKIKEKT